MKRMGQDMMNYERRSAHGDVPVWEMQFGFRIEIMIRQVRQIDLGLPADFLLQKPCISHGRTFLSHPIHVPDALERSDPKSLAVEDVNHLFTQRVETKARQFLRVVARRNCGQVVQDKIQGGVGPAMEFPHTVEVEHDHSLKIMLGEGAVPCTPDSGCESTNCHQSAIGVVRKLFRCNWVK